jgi:hypothetical protein
MYSMLMNLRGMGANCERESQRSDEIESLTNRDELQLRRDECIDQSIGKFSSGNSSEQWRVRGQLKSKGSVENQKCPGPP